MHAQKSPKTAISDICIDWDARPQLLLTNRKIFFSTNPQTRGVLEHNSEIDFIKKNKKTYLSSHFLKNTNWTGCVVAPHPPTKGKKKHFRWTLMKRNC